MLNHHEILVVNNNARELDIPAANNSTEGTESNDLNDIVMTEATENVSSAMNLEKNDQNKTQTSFKEEIAGWAIRNQIKHNHLNDLLIILRRN